MSKDFYFDDITKDLCITTLKDLRFTDNVIDYTTQKIEKVLSFVKGEWYLNTNLGIPYIAQKNNDRDDNTKNIFVKNPDLPFINALMIQKISSISTIEEIVDFTSELNTTTRDFSVNYEVKLTNGDILQSSVNIGVL